MSIKKMSDKRLFEVVLYAIANGKDKACEVYNVSQETIARYERAVKNDLGIDLSKVEKTAAIMQQYSDSEISAIAKGRTLHINNDINHIKVDTKSGEYVTIGVIADTHIGSLYCPEEMLKEIIQECNDTCNIVAHAGDVTEGMSGRPGHVYELSDIGYHRQREKAILLLSEIKKPTYVVDGNHDRWYIKSNGSLIVKDICDAIDNFTFCGHDVSDFTVNGAKVMLWHGEDGSSYALSYRLQKIIESLSGGRKPEVIIAGHAHKAGYFFIRNVHAVSAGSIQLQTSWMRGKRHEAHTGWWKIKLLINNNSVIRIIPEFIPFYL